LHKEHKNGFLEMHAPKKRNGRNFDDPFYCQVIAPNVDNFVGLADVMQNTFQLTPQSKSHTSPSQHSQLMTLLFFYEREQVHLFRHSQSLGHKITNTFEDGFAVVNLKKICTYLHDTTGYIDILQFICVAHLTTPPYELYSHSDITTHCDIPKSDTDHSSSNDTDSTADDSDKVALDEDEGLISRKCAELDRSDEKCNEYDNWEESYGEQI
jgi:hypothetical protein